MSKTRRQFLRTLASTPALLALDSIAPQFLLHAAESVSRTGDRILVVVQLSGGNDGLNTVIPCTDDLYYKQRPTLAIPRADTLRIDDQCGWHPALRGFDQLLQQQALTVVHGVGYPNPNRSHFESMDIWHTCVRKSETRQTGWLGRCLDQLATQESVDIPAMHLGQDKQPLALTAQHTTVPSVRSLEQFQLKAADSELVEKIRQSATDVRPQTSSLLDFVQSSSATALAVSERFQLSGKSYSAAAPYPESALGEKLRTIARLIDAGLPTRVYYVELDGFDTHAQQAPAHTALLRQLGDAVSVFIRDLGSHGHGRRTLVMGFSEFGRRLAENASEGTDHGAAAPVFLAGERVQAGLIGPHPSLSDLDEGDLKHHTDFRQIYATVLEHWLDCPANDILRGSYQSLPLFQT